MSENTVKIQPEKAEAVKAIRGDFEGIDNFIFTDYRGQK